MVQQRADDGEEHARRGELHAATRSVWLRQSAQTKDEGGRGGDVGNLNEEGADLRVHFGASVFLNIFSMRSVMTNPPTTLTVAAATAIAPMMLM